MSNINIIDQQITDWRIEGWNDAANNLQIFKELTDLTCYVSDDAENYYDVSNYMELLNDFAKLAEPDIKIEAVTGLSNEHWDISFICNDKTEIISLTNTDTDWLQDDFLIQLNSILKQHKSTRYARLVYAKNIEHADQCFDLCFITDEQFKLLTEQSPPYAG